MLGHDMSSIIGEQVREKLIKPFVDIEVCDLSICNRNETDNMATLRRFNCSMKSATIKVERDVMEMYQLKRMWQPPSSAIRNALAGALFRDPIVRANVPPLIKQWRKPIVVDRHAFGDQHLGRDLMVPGPVSLDVRYKSPIGSPYNMQLYDLKDIEGVVAVMSSTDKSIMEFAHACFQFALRRNLPLYLSTKETILKRYDGRFKVIFERLYEKHEPKFKDVRIFQHSLMDDMVARSLGTEGSFVCACKNNDGDIQSGFVARGFGSLGLIDALICPDGRTILADVAHGTVTKHFHRYEAGRETSTNSMATIFTWTKEIRHRVKLDGDTKLVNFARTLEKVVIQLFESGYITKEIVMCVRGLCNVRREDYQNTFRIH
ncbi:hypothetical protein HPB52_022756 [Rhipicephalus sanguineus]|uniref:Isocitrate dehydrogenase [NADP] n=1 Tax=Rhipicephalus sanguineus TaxID=34632 RepID=A0A9D4QCA7_RHISA|nr:hypothetical protein HPB52_022756 [Rhipicephalus sanguineus]